MERRRPETHIFHLPYGEITIIIEDMEVMKGLAVDGLPVVGKTNFNWLEKMPMFANIT